MELLFSVLCGLLVQDEWKPELKEVRIPMRDGKAIAADIYLPPKAGRYPTVLIQTPYDKKRLGAPIAGDKSEGPEAGRGAISDTLGLLDREHYAYVIVDWRGFFGSKEAMDGVKRGVWKRGQDGFDCVEWIARQAWSDGKVGTWGGSALGKQQFDTAIEQPPHLVCAVPLIASLGQTYESYYEGGVLLEFHVQMLDKLGFGVSAIVKANPKEDAIAWKVAERTTYRPDKIQVPCLLITGWWDNFPDQILKTFDDLAGNARAGSKLLIGPWDHVSVGLAKQGDRTFDGATKASADAARAFFDFHLRGADNGWDKSARVRYWTVNEEGWRDAESWSGIQRSSTSLWLAADGKIGNEKGAGSREYAVDPRNPTPTLGGANLPPAKHGPRSQSGLDKRSDVLVYTTGPLDRDLRVNGKVELSFEFTADRPTCDFTARLCEGDMLMADAIRRCRDVKPGEKQRVTLIFPATAVTFAKGRELRIYLSSSNWPRYERNSHTGADHWDEKTAVELKATIHHESAELKLPIRE